MDYIVISKNRACQLDLHIRCSLENLSELDIIYVLYAYDNEFYKKGYDKLIARNYPKVKWILEKKNFKESLLYVAEQIKGDYYLLLVDDIYIIKDFNTKMIDDLFSQFKNLLTLKIALSNTLQKNINNAKMLQPNFVCNEKNKLIWDWAICSRKTWWGYPSPAVESIYKKNYILPLLKKMIYENPALCEANLCKNVDYKKNYNGSFNETKFVKTSLNKVLTIYKTFAGNISTQFLNEKFLDNYIVDKQCVYDLDVTKKFEYLTLDLKFQKV